MDSDVTELRRRNRELASRNRELMSDVEVLRSKLKEGHECTEYLRDANHLLEKEHAVLLQEFRRSESELGHAERVGWERAFRTLDPVFRRIEAALQVKELDEFIPLLTSALEEYGRLSPPFVLSERDYLSAIETAQLLRMGRDRLRSVSPLELEYTVRGGGKVKSHRRYRREDVLRYAAGLERGRKSNGR